MNSRCLEALDTYCVWNVSSHVWVVSSLLLYAPLPPSLPLSLSLACVLNNGCCIVIADNLGWPTSIYFPNLVDDSAGGARREVRRGRKLFFFWGGGGLRYFASQWAHCSFAGKCRTAFTGVQRVGNLVRCHVGCNQVPLCIPGCAPPSPFSLVFPIVGVKVVNWWSICIAHDGKLVHLSFNIPPFSNEEWGPPKSGFLFFFFFFLKELC